MTFLSPVPPFRPNSCLRKHKSVTFDESIDEVDDMNRKRAKSLNDAYDIPRKQSSMIDLYAQTVKITPFDIANFTLPQNSNFNTFPRKSVSRKQSLEHIYDEIPIPFEVAKSGQDDATIYENQQNAEKTKL